MKIKKSRLISLCMILILMLVPDPGAGFGFPRYLLIIGLAAVQIMFDGMSIRRIEFSIWEYIYLFTLLGSYVIHFSRPTSYYGILSVLGFFVCTRYLMCIQIKRQVDVNWIIDVVLFLGCIYAALCLIEDFTQFNLFDIVFSRSVISGGANSFRSGVFRGHGVCSVSTNNAMLLYLIWILSTFKFYEKGCKRKYKVFFWIIGAATFMCQARMVILAGIVLQCVVAIRSGVSKAVRRFLLATTAVSVLLFFNPALQESINQMFMPIYEEIFLGETHSNIKGVSMYGSGHRAVLWTWVYETIKSNLLFGKGFVEQFKYTYDAGSYNATKTSIEVHWLYVMYQKGLFGLFGFISYQIGVLRLLFSNRNKRKIADFRFVMMVGTVLYFIMLFGCSGFEDLVFFYFMVTLYILYSKFENAREFDIE